MPLIRAAGGQSARAEQCTSVRIAGITGEFGEESKGRSSFWFGELQVTTIGR